MKRILMPTLLAAALMLVEHPIVATDSGLFRGLNYQPFQLRSMLRLRGGISKEAAEVGELTNVHKPSPICALIFFLWQGLERNRRNETTV